MKVSIIIPVFNVEKYVEECVNSALKQTYKDIEIIVVNDGSTDSSLDKLEKFSDRIKILSKKNGGKASAFNEGLKFVSGEWIKILDADDILYPFAIESLVNETKYIKDKTKTILYGNFDHIDSAGRIFANIKEPDLNELSDFEFNVRLLDKQIGNEDTILIHTSTLKEYGSYKEGIPFEDYEIKLRHCLLYGCRLHLINKTISKYRIHSNQITKKRIKISKKEQQKIRDDILNQLQYDEKQRYILALKKYKKSKPITEKIKTIIRYTILPKLPSSISKKIVEIYWKSHKINSE